MKARFSKLKILCITPIAIWLIFSFTNSTFAYFSDQQNSGNNIYSAGILSFDATSSVPFTPPKIYRDPTSSVSTISSFTLEKIGNLDFKYNAGTVIIGGTALCDVLQLQAVNEGVTEYSGSLSGFNILPITIGSDNRDDWVMTVTLPPGTPIVDTCNFNFVFNAWQTNFSDNSQGFTDFVTISNAISDPILEIEQVTDGEDESLLDNNVTGLSQIIIEDAGTLTPTTSLDIIISTADDNATSTISTISTDTPTPIVDTTDGSSINQEGDDNQSNPIDDSQTLEQDPQAVETQPVINPENPPIVEGGNDNTGDVPQAEQPIVLEQPVAPPVDSGALIDSGN